jgi:hypothetical protein
MTRQPDFDRVVTEWLDEGVDLAPERFVWAALDEVERTPQRAAWVATTEEFLMQFKRAAPVLGIAAAVVLAIVAFQILGSPSVGDPEPTPRVYAPEDLPDIILSEGNAPEGLEADVDTRMTGVDALVTPLRPGGETIDTTHFVDALRIDLSGSTGGFTTWAALFETPEAAAEAFAFLVTEHESPEGWDLAASRRDPGLGEESAMWTGQQYDMTSAGTIMWRQGNLILAAVGWADWNSEEVRMIADLMANRAK